MFGSLKNALWHIMFECITSPPKVEEKGRLEKSKSATIDLWRFLKNKLQWVELRFGFFKRCFLGENWNHLKKIFKLQGHPRSVHWNVVFFLLQTCSTISSPLNTKLNSGSPTSHLSAITMKQWNCTRDSTWRRLSLWTSSETKMTDIKSKKKEI